MKKSFKQGKRDKDITLTIKLSWYELRHVVCSTSASGKCSDIAEFIDWLETVLDNTDEPA